ncbi:hypothetical protein HPP92_016059 [Vanilla planifolia]|uniref:Uncharacterized protein n=1 Tax=Vanilla planifolia TaxID=51239 RepID=A0A835QMX4_VANPL|nr:hypothetical protein HPP92_016668 [Vanilla planifolia]KAG0471513.1 hypothetical protein HPP92_016059 [Vanilla planifolia]
MDCPAPFKSSSSKSLKNLLHRNPRSPSKSYSSSCLPLLGDFDSDSAASSAGTSLSSSSSSSADHEDLPRLSLDSGRINSNSTFLCRNPPRARSANGRPLATRRQPSDLISGCSIAVRPIRPAPESVAEGYMAMKSAQGLLPRATGEDDDLAPLRCSAVDSPRLNASGKVIFQGIGRSSSSPSICNGFRRPRPRGMERSYSANVLVTPVLNVPVCTVRGTAKPVYAFGFGQLFSQQKKEKDGASPVKSLTCQTNGVAKRT